MGTGWAAAKAAGSQTRTTTQPVVGIEACRLRVHQPVIPPGCCLMNWLRRLEMRRAPVQQHLGAGQLGHEVAVLQGEIRVDEVAIIEADLACRSASRGQPRRSASSATALPLPRILDASGDDDTALATSAPPSPGCGAAWLASLPRAPGLLARQPIAEGRQWSAKSR